MEPQPSAPPVVAVVVANEPGDWFEEALVALGSQDAMDVSDLPPAMRSDAEVSTPPDDAPIAARPAASASDLEELEPRRDRRSGEDGGAEYAHDGGALAPARAIRRRFAIEPMNCTPSPRSRLASSRLDAIFLTAFQMYRGRK